MKRIFTSYYAVAHNHPQAKSVSVSCPDFYKKEHLEILKPPVGIFRALKKGYISKELYKMLYKKMILNKININFLDSLLEDGDVLLCWEKDVDTCHRKLISDFLNSHGYKCEELTFISTVSRKKKCESLQLQLPLEG